jgi:hypothetical protein
MTDAGWRDILDRITRDPRYIEGIAYGRPRAGHEEGSVANHIGELLRSLVKLGVAAVITEEETWKLEILIQVHDTFKLAGMRFSDNHQVSLRDPRSHPMLARQFLSEFTNDEAMLAVAQWHDEGHALWKQVEAKGKFSVVRLDEALRGIPDIELYLLFTVIDSHTVSKLKDRSPKWFLDIVRDHCAPAEPYRAYVALRILEQQHHEQWKARDIAETEQRL